MLLVVQQLSTKLCCGMKHGDQISVMLCCLLQHKNNEVSRRSAQGPVKKADKSKPMHQSFRLFSEQPTIDKKKRLVQRQGAVSLGAELCRCDMEPGADMSMCMGHGCHQLMWGVLSVPTKTKEVSRRSAQDSQEEGGQKQGTASEFPAVQQATNDRQKGW